MRLFLAQWARTPETRSSVVLVRGAQAFVLPRVTKPTFGICMGHKIIGMAAGLDCVSYDIGNGVT